jgi:hypothetical protein
MPNGFTSYPLARPSEVKLLLEGFEPPINRVHPVLMDNADPRTPFDFSVCVVYW